MRSMCYTFLFIAFVAVAIEFEFTVIKPLDFCDYRQDPIAFVVRATIWIVMIALILYILLKSVFQKTVYFDLSGSGWKGNVGLLTVVTPYALKVVGNSIVVWFNPHIIILWDGDKADDNNLTIGNTVKVLYDLFTSMGYEVTVVARFGRAAWIEHREGKLNKDLDYYGKNLEIIWSDEEWQDVLDKDGKPVLNKDGTPSRKPVYTGHKSVHGEDKRQRQKAIIAKGKEVHGVFAFGGFLSKQDYEMCIDARCNVAVWHTSLEYITNLRNIAVEAGYDVGLIYIAIESGNNVDFLNPEGVVMKEGYISNEGSVLRFIAKPRKK